MILAADVNDVNWFITYGFQKIGLPFFLIFPILFYIYKLLNDKTLDVIRNKWIDKISSPKSNNILFDTKQTILNEIEDIYYKDSVNKTKILKTLCRMLVEKSYLVATQNKITSESITSEYNNVKEQFKTFLILEYGPKKGKDLYNYVIPVLSTEISVLIYNLTLSLDILKTNDIKDDFYTHSNLYIHVKSVIRKFEFGFHQFNGQIDNIINN